MSIQQRSTRMLLACVAATTVVYGACSAVPQTPSSPSAAIAASGSMAGIPTGPSPNPRQADFEYFEVCKDYVGGSGPAVTVTVQVDEFSDGTINHTHQVSLAGGECKDVWVQGGTTAHLVTVTEAVPAGFTASFVRSVLTNTTTVTDPPVAGNSASGPLKGSQGTLVIFTNTAEVQEAGSGRFTGGGGQIIVGNTRVTRGLTIHCDRLLSNNLEVNWNGNQFHMTDHLTTVACFDSPTVDQRPPNAPIDTLIGIGTGRYNGTSGYTVEFTLIDAGEPGTNDQTALKIFQASNPANVVLTVPLQKLSNGNLQAHADQPHK